MVMDMELDEAFDIIKNIVANEWRADPDNSKNCMMQISELLYEKGFMAE